MSAATVSPISVDAHALVEALDGVEFDDPVGVRAGLVAAQRLALWTEAQRLRLLAALGSRDEAIDELTRCGTTSPGEASRVVKRAQAAAQSPEFAQALAAGAITPAHVDRFGESLRRLDNERRARMLANAERLVADARATTPSEFERMLRVEERRLGHQTSHTEHQARTTRIRCRSWIDRDSGIGHWQLSLDPQRHLQLHNTISAVVEALFHGEPIPGCPDDPDDKLGYLRAHAMLRLLDGNGPRMAKPEILVVVTTTDNGQTPTIDWGLPGIDIADRVLDTLNDAKITTVVIRNRIILSAPGTLNLGRSTRLANTAQRRALRALHRTCIVPGCSVTFDKCTIHHIHWWRHSGTTDLTNLGPLCHRHPPFDPPRPLDPHPQPQRQHHHHHRHRPDPHQRAAARTRAMTPNGDRSTTTHP